MKKNKLLLIFMFVVSLFVVCGNVKAAEQTITIYEDEYPEVEIYNGSDRLRQVNIIKAETNSSLNDNRVYCMSMGDKAPGNGTVMNLDGGKLSDSAVYAYIINNSSRINIADTVNYKVKIVGTQNSWEQKNIADVSIAYLRKQFAIWYYQNNGSITYDQSPYPDITSNVLAAYSGIKDLVADAKSNKNVLNIPLKVTIDGNASMKLSEDGNTYESEKLTVTSSRGGKVNLSIINNGIKGIEIYNEKGKKVTEEISSGSKVIIKVPVDSLKLGVSSFKLNAQVTGEEYGMYKYSSSGIQSVGRLEKEKDITAETSKTFSIEKKSTTKFSKISVVDQKELPGATLRILNENKEVIMDEEGNPLYEWVSTDEPHYIEGLPAGKYYLEEVIAPEGYVLSNELVEFEVKDDGSITEVVMENDLEVEVPDTLSSRSMLLLVIGMIDIALGIGILLYVKKNKATE